MKKTMKLIVFLALAAASSLSASSAHRSDAAGRQGRPHVADGSRETDELHSAKRSEMAKIPEWAKKFIRELKMNSSRWRSWTWRPPLSARGDGPGASSPRPSEPAMVEPTTTPPRMELRFVVTQFLSIFPPPSQLRELVLSSFRILNETQRDLMFGCISEVYPEASRAPSPRPPGDVMAAMFQLDASTRKILMEFHDNMTVADRVFRRCTRPVKFIAKEKINNVILEGSRDALRLYMFAMLSGSGHFETAFRRYLSLFDRDESTVNFCWMCYRSIINYIHEDWFTMIAEPSNAEVVREIFRLPEHSGGGLMTYFGKLWMHMNIMIFCTEPTM